jgi:transcriptional regulator with XRE-family HTH domain
MAKKVIKEVDAHVGALVRKRRIAIGMSQTTLAEAIGLTFQQVQKYEKGTNRIGASRLSEIANALQVPPTYFFDGAPTAARLVPGKHPSTQFVSDFVVSAEGNKLMKAFVKLQKDVQRSVAQLVAKIAKE